MSFQASEVTRRLADCAEAVCRHYLSNGRRQGRYWIVGDVANTPGRSLYVRLHGPPTGRGAAGKWTDAATGEHGDLLDLIALNRALDQFRDVLDEACTFLSLPRPQPKPGQAPCRSRATEGSQEGARRLFRSGCPVPGSLAETYLRARGITATLDWPCLRFHPSFYRSDDDAPRKSLPAMLAAVTDSGGQITGVQRTWLDADRLGKAALVDPRRALGDLLGNGVRFGVISDVLAVGEGIETMLSLKSLLPELPMIAGLSATHLAALRLPPSLCRLYVARDNDPAGRLAMERLQTRGSAIGIEVRGLAPAFDDFNTDLMRFGAPALRCRLVPQLHPLDRRFAADVAGPVLDGA